MNLSRHALGKAFTQDTCYVYIWLINDVPIYIGKGNGLRAWTLKGRNKWLTRTVLKARDAGVNVEIRLLEDDLPSREALDLEKRFIALFGRKDLGLGPLLNLTDGGEGNSGKKVSDETKKKISLALTGTTHTVSEETRKKLSLANKGKKYNVSEETRQKFAIAAKERHLGAKRSEETKARLSEARRLWWVRKRAMELPK